MSIYQTARSALSSLVQTRAQSIEQPGVPLTRLRHAGRTADTVTADEAMGIPAVAKCVHLIADTVSGLPLHVYRRADGGRERDRTHVADGLLNRLADPYLPAAAVRRQVTLHALVRGNGFAEVVRRGTRPAALLVLDPSTVTCRTIRAGSDIARQYVVRNGADPERTLPYSDVLHVPGWPSPDGEGWEGRSFVDYAAEALAGVRNAQRYRSDYYANGGHPGVVMTVPRASTDEQVDEAKAWYRDEHVGPGRAHKIAAVKEGTTIATMDTTGAVDGLDHLKDADLTTVANLFGLPGSVVGAPNNLSYKSPEADARALTQYALDPWLVRWEAAAGLLLDEVDRAGGGRYVEHVRAALYQSDSATQAKSLILQSGGPILTPNEARAVQNLPAVPGGDDLRVPQGAAAGVAGGDDGADRPPRGDADTEEGATDED